MNDIREDLKAYVDGELNETRAAEVAAAISADPELAQEAEFMKMLGFEIKRMAPEPTIEGRAEAISKVSSVRGRVSWSPFTWPLAWQAAAGIACIAMVGTALSPFLLRSRSGGFALSESVAPASAVPNDSLARDEAVKAPDTTGAQWQGGFGGAPTETESKSKPRPGIEGGEMLDNKGREIQPSGAKTTVPMKSGADKRLVIKNADMSVRVDSARKAMESAGTIADSLGGFVINSSSNDLEGTEPSGTVVMRVPATRFDLAMQKLRALGKVTNESSTGEDVTAQVADIGARLKVLRAEEDSYITMLRAARRVNEMLEIKERLSGVRQEIESLTAQITALKDMATLSTITATFHQKVSINKPEEDPKDGFEETWAGAVNGLKAVGTFLTNVVIVIFVYSPIWLPVVGIAWWLTKRNRKAS